jgi:hypothetical protein
MIEPIEATDINYPSEPELTDSEKLQYLYQVAVRADKLLTELAPQVGPLLESVAKNPMLKMFMR